MKKKIKFFTILIFLNIFSGEEKKKPRIKKKIRSNSLDLKSLSEMSKENPNCITQILKEKEKQKQNSFLPKDFYINEHGKIAKNPTPYQKDSKKETKQTPPKKSKFR